MRIGTLAIIFYIFLFNGPIFAVGDSLANLPAAGPGLSELLSEQLRNRTIIDSLLTAKQSGLELGFQYIFAARQTVGPIYGSPRSSFSQEIRISISPEKESILEIDLGLRTEKTTALDYSRGLAFNVDQAVVTIKPAPWFRASAGRIYFILDRLGLIADNYHDALEGVDFFVQPGKVWGLRAVYSRLSSTNYPRRRYFKDKDDYWALKTFWDLGRFEIGANCLFSGISTEKGYALDGYFSLGKREAALEFARYRPSSSNWFEAVTWKQAWVGGLDVLKGQHYELFVQCGDVARGFAPMASSLAYSTGGQHLYFDYNTKGIDATLRLWLSSGDDGKTQGGAKPDRDYAYKPLSVAELEWVGLRDQEGRPVSQKYIARISLPFYGRINLMAENNYFVNHRPESGSVGKHDYASLILSVHF